MRLDCRVSFWLAVCGLGALLTATGCSGGSGGGEGEDAALDAAYAAATDVAARPGGGDGGEADGHATADGVDRGVHDAGEPGGVDGTRRGRPDGHDVDGAERSEGDVPSLDAADGGSVVPQDDVGDGGVQTDALDGGPAVAFDAVPEDGSADALDVASGADGTQAVDGAEADAGQGSGDAAGTACVTDADCAEVEADLGPCQQAVCDTGTQTCVVADAPAGTACDDGNPCTEGSTCEDGQCQGGTAVPGCVPGCVVDEGPGCAGCECESCVCDGIDAFCCDVQWDETCVALCAQECGQDCTAATPEDCCTTHAAPGCSAGACEDCVCAGHPTCCSVAWDDACVVAAELTCLGPCGCSLPMSGDCCSAHPGEGCESMGCTECVCTKDPMCCTTAWDGSCAGLAHSPACGAACPQCSATNPYSCAGFCGGIAPGGCACNPAICKPPSPWGGGGGPPCCDDMWQVCCTPQCAGKECGDDGCGGSCGTCPQGASCVDGQCMCSWGSSCSSDCTPQCAGKECGDDGCGGSCGTCPVGAACNSGACEPVCGDGICLDGQEDCTTCADDCGPCGCQPTGAKGCDGCACEACVCAADPACCDVAWDAACALKCQDDCGVDCGLTPCKTDAECFDGDPCTKDTCDADAGVCQTTPVTSCCEYEADCPLPGDLCTEVTCELGECLALPGCCNASEDCLGLDAVPCAVPQCSQGACELAAPAACCTSDGVALKVDFESTVPVAAAHDAAGSWSWTSDDAHGGSHSLRFAFDPTIANGSADVLSDWVAIAETASSATLSVWVRIDGPGSLDVQWNPLLTGLPDLVAHLDGPTSGWVEVTADLAQGIGRVGHVSLHAPAGNGVSAVWVDDLTVQAPCGATPAGP